MFWDRIVAAWRAFRGVAPEPKPPEPSFIDALVSDADLVAAYGRYSGTLKDDTLLVTLGAVHDLPDSERRMSQPAVVRLQLLLNDATRTVPFATLSELKGGWKPQLSAVELWRRTAGLLLMSILLMMVTVQLTYVYNKGSTILGELQEVSTSQVRQDFNRLIREYMQAKNQLSLDGDDSSSGQIDIAWPTLISTEAELAAMSDRLSIASTVASNYVNRDGRFLIWPLRLVYCGVTAFGAPPASAGVAAAFAQAEQRAATCGTAARTRTVEDEATPASLPANYAQASSAGCWADGSAPVQEKAPSTLPRQLASFSQTARNLACARVISFPPENFPGFNGYITSINETLTFLGLGILPGLYGALGAIMYFMRMILDPLRPNPPIYRVVHRAILGALAGIVLSWLFIPDSPVESIFSQIGFSLFVLAFLFGFSLDVFFALLDRFVTLSVSRIGQFGSEKPQAPGGAPPSVSR